MASVKATMVQMMKFFGSTPAKFRAEWNKLTVEDQDALRAGIGDGSLTY